MERGGENQMCRCRKFLQIKLHIRWKGINLVDSLFHEFLSFFAWGRKFIFSNCGDLNFVCSVKGNIND